MPRLLEFFLDSIAMVAGLVAMVLSLISLPIPWNVIVIVILPPSVYFFVSGFVLFVAEMKCVGR